MSRRQLPPPVIGLTAEPTTAGQRLVGVVGRDLVVPAGTTVTLRKIRPEAQDDCGASYALVFGAVTDTAADLEQERRDRDAAWLAQWLPERAA